MSIFGDLWQKITGHHQAQSAPVAVAANAPSPAPSAQPAEVDVEGVLQGLAAHNTQKLNWKTSVVDLLKLVGMDSSLQARKELAKELGYTGDTSDSASMNIWLHKAVMKKMAENGGRVPADLLH